MTARSTHNSRNFENKKVISSPILRETGIVGTVVASGDAQEKPTWTEGYSKQHVQGLPRLCLRFVQTDSTTFVSKETWHSIIRVARTEEHAKKKERKKDETFQSAARFNKKFPPAAWKIKMGESFKFSK